MGIDEYLDGVFKDAFKRELEVDENVARTLPFFAAALALAATLYGYVLSRLPPPTYSGVAIALDILLVGGVSCLVGVLWNLFQAVRMREYRIPPKETELADWVGRLREYYAGQGQTLANVETQALADLRQRMIDEYAKSAEHNREANTPKLKARAWGFTLLVATLTIAFSMIGIMFVTDWIGAASRQGTAHDPNSKVTAAAAAKIGRTESTATAAASGAAGRCEISMGPCREHGGGKMTESSDQAPAANPHSGQTPATPAPTPAQPPAAPTHQILKKSEDGGGMIQRR